MDIHEWPCRIKSARRKRRLVKTDRDQQLIQLSKRRNQLWEQKHNLPMVPLEHPYQRGWKRLFVLRDDQKQIALAEFYEELLKKINTVQYHHDRSFKTKKRRKRKYGYKMRKQELKQIDQYYWDRNTYKLSEKEQACFTKVSSIDRNRRLDIKYVFTEPWRFVLKVMPHMVTQVQLHDEELQQEIAAVAHRIKSNFFEPRIQRLTNGRPYNRRYDEFDVRPQYINILKNIPRYTPKEAYLELDK